MESIQNYPGGPNVITDTLIREKGEGQSERREGDDGEGEVGRCCTAGIEHGAKSRTTECRSPVEVRTGKETSFPLKSPEGTHSCQHLDFKLLPPKL